MTWSHSMSGTVESVRNDADASFRSALANHNVNEQQQGSILGETVEKALLDATAHHTCSVSASGHAGPDATGNRALYISISTSDVPAPNPASAEIGDGPGADDESDAAIGSAPGEESLK